MARAKRTGKTKEWTDLDTYFKCMLRNHIGLGFITPTTPTIKGFQVAQINIGSAYQLAMFMLARIDVAHVNPINSNPTFILAWGVEPHIIWVKARGPKPIDGASNLVASISKKPTRRDSFRWGTCLCESRFMGAHISRLIR